MALGGLMAPMMVAMGIHHVLGALLLVMTMLCVCWRRAAPFGGAGGGAGGAGGNGKGKPGYLRLEDLDDLDEDLEEGRLRDPRPLPRPPPPTRANTLANTLLSTQPPNPDPVRGRRPSHEHQTASSRAPSDPKPPLVVQIPSLSSTATTSSPRAGSKLTRAAMATSAASPSAIAAAATPRPPHGFVSHAEWAPDLPFVCHPMLSEAPPQGATPGKNSLAPPVRSSSEDLSLASSLEEDEAEVQKDSARAAAEIQGGVAAYLTYQRAEKLKSERELAAKFVVKEAEAVAAWETAKDAWVAVDATIARADLDSQASWQSPSTATAIVEVTHTQHCFEPFQHAVAEMVLATRTALLGVDEEALAREEERRQLEAAEAMKRAKHYALTILAHHQESRAWRTWKAVTEEAWEKKLAWVRCRAFFIRTYRRKGFDQWYDVASATWSRELQIITEIETCRQSRAFGRWRVDYEADRMMRKRLVKLAHRCKYSACFQAFANPTADKYKAFERLRDHAAARRARQAAVAKFTAVQVPYQMRLALLHWNESSAAARTAEERTRRVLARLNPASASMLKALEKLHEHALFVHKVESAARGFLYGHVRRGFMTWAGLRQEKLVHQQQVVWLAVQRGHRVGALQEMFEEITPSVIEELIQMKDAQGTTPLLWASKRGFGDIVEVLLAFSNDLESVVGACDADGCCPLHHAARRHHNEIVAMLLDAGADVHAKNSVDKSTALHWAARKDNGVAIQMLLEAGADREAQNSWGATPLDNALFAKCWHAVQLLATDAETLRAAAEELAIERIVRPTAEERHEKLAKLAMNTMVQRENRRQKLEAQHQAREQQQAAIDEAARAARRQGAADRALARALLPAAGHKLSVTKQRTASPRKQAPGGNGGGGARDGTPSSPPSKRAGGKSSALSLRALEKELKKKTGETGAPVPPPTTAMAPSCSSVAPAEELWRGFSLAQHEELKRCVEEARAAVEEAGPHAMDFIKKRLTEAEAWLDDLAAVNASAVAGNELDGDSAAETSWNSASSLVPAELELPNDALLFEATCSLSPVSASELTPPPAHPSASPSSGESLSSRHSHRSPKGASESPMQRQVRKDRLKARTSAGHKTPGPRRKI